MKKRKKSDNLRWKNLAYTENGKGLGRKRRAHRKSGQWRPAPEQEDWPHTTGPSVAWERRRRGWVSMSTNLYSSLQACKIIRLTLPVFSGENLKIYRPKCSWWATWIPGGKWPARVLSWHLLQNDPPSSILSLSENNVKWELLPIKLPMEDRTRSLGDDPDVTRSHMVEKGTEVGEKSHSTDMQMRGGRVHGERRPTPSLGNFRRQWGRAQLPNRLRSYLMY